MDEADLFKYSLYRQNVHQSNKQLRTKLNTYKSLCSPYTF
jgi:hypothetical protein